MSFGVSKNMALIFRYLFYLLFTAPACVQAVLMEDLFSLSLEELLAVEVSGASFSLESLAYTPASVTVFTAQEIQQLGVHELQELTNLVPGFQSKRQSDGVMVNSISSRGRQVGTGTRSVKIIINGQAITSGYIGSSITSFNIVPLDNVSKIEFIRGPGSVVFGSGALLGIINIETFQEESYLKVGLGNNGYAANAVNYQSDGLQFSAIFKNSQGDQYSLKDVDSGTHIPSSDPSTQGHIYLSKKFEESYYSFHSHHLNASDFYSFDRVDDGLNNQEVNYSSASFQRIISSSDFYDITLSGFFNRRVYKFSALLSAPGVLNGASIPNSEAPIRAFAISKSNDYGLKLLSDWLFIDGHFSMGSEYYYAEPVTATAFANFNLQQLSQASFPVDYYGNNPVATPFVKKQESHTLAIFAEYQQQISPQLNTIYSLRYDYAQNIKEGELLPRVSFIYELNEHHFLKALYSQAFRNPDAIEIGAINNNTLLGDENLSSETITSQEIVWFSQYPNFYLNVAVFENQIDNAIEQTSIGGKRIFINQDKENNQGLELEYRHQLSKNLSIRSSYTHMSKMLNSAFRVSERNGSVTLSANQGRWQGNVISAYQSSAQMLMNANADRLTLPSFWYHNVSFNYQHRQNMQSQIIIKNLMDHQYFTPTISSILDEGIPAKGREVMYSIKVLF